MGNGRYNEFFEKYFGRSIRMKNIIKVTVEDFELGGMENTDCTTLTKNILHDEKVFLIMLMMF